jgi:hypothetical protein
MKTTGTDRLLDSPIYSLGHEIDTSPEVFGWLRSSEDRLGDFAELGGRLEREGYLYLPGFWGRARVEQVRASLLGQLARMGYLKPGTPVEAGIHDPENPPPAMARSHPLDQRDPALVDLLFGQETMEFYAGLFGEQAAHFDFTWFRTKGAGHGSDVHCDIVYMGRGTKRLLTMWTPLGDIGPKIGGLTILEGSHRRQELLNGYLERDVDRYCANGAEAEAHARGEKGWNGSLSKNPVAIRERFGSRWLTSPEFRMGDALIFGMAMVHGSLDNQTEWLRLSVDTRYQRASEPRDPRWFGEAVIGHGPAAKEGVIC